jgi:hypothetical protein
MSILSDVLLNIVIFAAFTFTTSLLVERGYFSRLRWLLVLLFAAVLVTVYICRDNLVGMIEALTGKNSYSGILLVVAAGILSGIFISASCVIFRGVVTAVKWIVMRFFGGSEGILLCLLRKANNNEIRILPVLVSAWCVLHSVMISVSVTEYLHKRL